MEMIKERRKKIIKKRNNNNEKKRMNEQIYENNKGKKEGSYVQLLPTDNYNPVCVNVCGDFHIRGWACVRLPECACVRVCACKRVCLYKRPRRVSPFRVMFKLSQFPHEIIFRTNKQRIYDHVLGRRRFEPKDTTQASDTPDAAPRHNQEGMYHHRGYTETTKSQPPPRPSQPKYNHYHHGKLAKRSLSPPHTHNQNSYTT